MCGSCGVGLRCILRSDNWWLGICGILRHLLGIETQIDPTIFQYMAQTRPMGLPYICLHELTSKNTPGRFSAVHMVVDRSNQSKGLGGATDSSRSRNPRWFESIPSCDLFFFWGVFLQYTYNTLTYQFKLTYVFVWLFTKKKHTHLLGVVVPRWDSIRNL